MLILTRKNGQKLIINDNIEIVVLESNNNNVKIGIKAPRNVSIYRDEIYQEVKNCNNISNNATFKDITAIPIENYNHQYECENKLNALVTKVKL